ncbi:MAG: hypothetical protein ACOCP8_08080 [archaeon]
MEITKTMIVGLYKDTSLSLVDKAVKSARFDPEMVISGSKKMGIDYIGIEWAETRGYPYKSFKIEYDKDKGYYAVLKRNKKLKKYVNSIIVIYEYSTSNTMLDSVIRFAELNDKKLSTYYY